MADNTLEVCELAINSEVTVTDLYVPLTGLFATETDIGGWVWNRRRVEKSDDNTSRYETYVGGHDYGVREGSIKSDWKSGTISGVRYTGLGQIGSSDYLGWTPVVQTGSYAVWFQDMRLYSDYSVVDRLSSTALESGTMVKTLDTEATHSTVSVALYRRGAGFIATKLHDYARVESFTGTISGDTRESTVDGLGNILWDKVEDRKREFLIQDNRVWLNQDGSYEVCPSLSSPTREVLDDLAENKGLGSPDGRLVYLDYFPVEPNTVQIFVSTISGVVEQWTEVESLNLSTATDKHYSVDYDLGIVELGGYQADSLVLKTDITDTSDTLEVYLDLDTISLYPDWGVLLVGSEYIYYDGKGRSGFTNLVRGYWGSTAAAHSAGTLVEDIKHGSGTAATDSIFATYLAVPRVEYEVSSYNRRSSNATKWLDVSPLSNVDGSGIFQLTTSIPHISEIVLETSSAPIGGNLYGPVYFGTDVSRLVATAYDSMGNPVPDVEINLDIYQGPGRLNGFGSTRSAVSNSLGEVYGLYNAPYTNDSVYHSVLSVTHDGLNTSFEVENLSPSLNRDEIGVFQILKHDKTQGTTGTKSSIVSVSSEKVVIYDHWGESFIGGSFEVIGTDGIKYTREIVRALDTLSSGLLVSELTLNQILDGALVTGQDCYGIESDAVQWDPYALNGAKVILYQWDENAQHPITSAAGAFMPVRPDQVAENLLVFEGRTLPIPAPDSLSSNLGGYAVIASSDAHIYAWAKDPATGRIVSSNTIVLRIAIPQFLTGVDYSGALPIPYGFTFVTEEFNVGTGLGGTNFLTINPKAEGINAFSIYAEV